MTQLEILRLAYTGALNVWEFWKKRQSEHPENEVYRTKELEAHRDMQTIAKLITEENARHFAQRKEETTERE